ESTVPKCCLATSPSCTPTLARPRSPQNRSTRRPRRASAVGSVSENQELPTPPVPEATATIRPDAGAPPEREAVSMLGWFIGAVTVLSLWEPCRRLERREAGPPPCRVWPVPSRAQWLARRRFGRREDRRRPRRAGRLDDERRRCG